MGTDTRDAVLRRIATLPANKRHEAARRASCSYSSPQTAILRGARIESGETIWPDGERYPIGPGRCFTVRAHDAAETVLVEHVDMNAALDAHEAANGHATIYDDADGQQACMAEYCHMGACECHRCAETGENMKAKEVKIGETYKTKIGTALVKVKVTGEAPRRENYSTGKEGPPRFFVQRVDNGTRLPKPRTAAALRPV